MWPSWGSEEYIHLSLVMWKMFKLSILPLVNRSPSSYETAVQYVLCHWQAVKWETFSLNFVRIKKTITSNLFCQVSISKYLQPLRTDSFLLMLSVNWTHLFHSQSLQCTGLSKWNFCFSFNPFLASVITTCQHFKCN